MPGVSVIIPCYNHAGYLGETIESVLAQTLPAAEIIVVDDGSPDASAEVAERYASSHPAVRLLRQANAGRSAAANHGLRESTGEFLVFLDADDRLLPHALAAGMAQLDAHLEAAFAAGHCVHIDSNGLRLETSAQPLVTADFYVHMLQENFIWNPGNVLFRRAAVEAVGGFDTTLKHAEDYSLYLRILRDRPMIVFPEVVAEYRQHVNNKSKSAHTMLRTVLQILDQETVSAARHPQSRQARQAGIRQMKRFYGDRCVLQFVAHLGPSGDCKKAWETLKTILPLCPEAFLRYAKRQVVSKFRGTSLQRRPV